MNLCRREQRNAATCMGVIVILHAIISGGLIAVIVADDVPNYFGRGTLPARRSEYVWFSAIRQKDNLLFICGGTLIGSRYVVTASHCLESNDRSVVVEVSYFCPYWGNCERESDTVDVKEAWTRSGGDMSLLFLDRSVESTIQPAVPYLGPSIHPLQSQWKKGQTMNMVTAGRSGTDDDLSETVSTLPVRYFPKNKCRKKFSKPLVGDFDVCSIVVGRGSPCAGDSGVAIVVPGRSELAGRDVVLAIHTLGPRNCSSVRKRQPLVHFRMEDAATLIQQVVCLGDFPEDWCGVANDDNDYFSSREEDERSDDGNRQREESDYEGHFEGNVGPTESLSVVKKCKVRGDKHVQFVLNSDEPQVVRKCGWLRNVRRLTVYCASEKSEAKTKCPGRCDWNCK